MLWGPFGEEMSFGEKSFRQRAVTGRIFAAWSSSQCGEQGAESSQPSVGGRNPVGTRGNQADVAAVEYLCF